MSEPVYDPYFDLVIVHSDCPDGFCAAWLCHLAAGGRRVEYVQAAYGDAPPDVSGRRVLVADFSYPRDVLDAMAETAASLLVLDHHATAAEALEGAEYAIFDMDRSGAGLVLDVVHGGGRALPHTRWVARYVEDRDLWRGRLPQSDACGEYLHSLPRRGPDDFAAWTTAAWQGRDSAALYGRVLCRVRDQYVEELSGQAVECAVPGTGHVLPCVCAPRRWRSQLLHAVASAHPSGRALGWYPRGDGRVDYSLRGTEGHPVRDLAEALGGGGHDLAAGAVGDWTPLG